MLPAVRPTCLRRGPGDLATASRFRPSAAPKRPRRRV